MVRRISRLALVLATFSILAFSAWSPSAALAAPGCGDGILDGGEECDGGPGGLFVDGDPAGGSCASGSRCYFQFTCCKFNCQYVGTPGVPCQDNNSCSGPDICNQVGQCNGTANVANGTPCDDGLYCTGTESCTNGTCTGSTGDPCPGTACNLCQEATDTCFDPVDSSCSDGSACIVGGTCDGAGTCNGGVPGAGPCDDGIFCNGTDTCGGGACSVHSGDPCPGGDGDGNCAESCNEDAGNCTANDVEASDCDDGLFCDGATDQCVSGVCTGTGSVACDDNNSCTTDVCDEGTDSCSVGGVSPDGSPCDDADSCSLDDTCQAGACAGASPLLDDLCPWTLVMRENPKKDLIKANFRLTVNGDVCGGSIRFGQFTEITSDLVSGKATGTGEIRLTSNDIIGDDIVTAGAGITATPASDVLPYVTPAVSVLAPGSTTPKSDASGTFDLTGTNPLATECLAARQSYLASTAALDSLAQTSSLALVNVPLGGAQTITATNVGSLNVVDIAGILKLGRDSTLTLDGGGSADTVLVLRVGGKMQMLLRSAIEFAGGLTPNHTMIYVKGKLCLLADLSIGGGTLFCSPARLKTGRTVAWVGSLYGDGKLMRIRERTSMHFTPFDGF